MMKELYRKYFQKSNTFLYPLLRFKKNKHPKPVQTFISCDGEYTHTDRKLLCLYKIENTEQWKNFETSHLMPHTMLETSVLTNDDHIVYVFDFDLPEIRDDFDRFLDGQYSKFSVNAKKLITNFYGIHTPEWVYIESYIHPSKYFKNYAEILGVDEQDLRKGGELCDRYSVERENIKLPK